MTASQNVPAVRPRGKLLRSRLHHHARGRIRGARKGGRINTANGRTRHRAGRLHPRGRNELARAQHRDTSCERHTTRSTQTTENSAATAQAAPPPIELGIAAPLTDGPQQVMDEQGNPSALYVGPGRVGINTAPGFPLTVYGADCSAQVQTATAEASMEFLCNDGMHWHIGSGSGAGPETFFIWNPTSAFSLIAKPGAVTIFGNVQMPNLPAAVTAPGNATLVSLLIDPATGTVYQQ